METVRRGYELKDTIEFGPRAAEKLNAAAQEVLLLLSERQRMALARIVSTQEALEERERKKLCQAPESLVLDGFNTIITLEVALSGSLLLEGMDGTIRDLAGLWGSYRIVDKTVHAVELLLRPLPYRECSHCRCNYLGQMWPLVLFEPWLD